MDRVPRPGTSQGSSTESAVIVLGPDGHHIEPPAIPQRPIMRQAGKEICFKREPTVPLLTAPRILKARAFAVSERPSFVSVSPVRESMYKRRHHKIITMASVSYVTSLAKRVDNEYKGFLRGAGKRVYSTKIDLGAAPTDTQSCQTRRPRALSRYVESRRRWKNIRALGCSVQVRVQSTAGMSDGRQE
ncbi:hypothetical protein BC628DRAFT_1048184 [Trametes gibbosa]|nr:hypothetical protein BC628DRAFT_1048184 [Trametes gibbosa]